MNYFFVVLYKLKSISLYNFSSKYILEILFFRDIIFVWGISAVGSAPHSHCGGHGFESRMLHIRQELPAEGRKLFFIFTALLTSRAPAA